MQDKTKYNKIMIEEKILKLKSSKEDKFFVKKKDAITDFKFDDKVVKVFDDMVTRSVPYYAEIQRMTVELAADFAKPNTNIYDIGCSTGTTMALFDEVVDKSVNFVGLDNSKEMLEKAKKKLSHCKRDVSLKFVDLNKSIKISNASVATLILTLQFVRPLYRDNVVQAIYDGLNKGGAFILVEKVTSEDTMFNRLFIKHYYEYKQRNGYSEMEIKQKREALENVLIPYRMEENFDMLKKVGFKKIEVFFRWYNFCAIIAVK
jgi:tRNA (cmo5U34)-methyltransferase